MKDRERREGRGQRKPYWFPYVSPYCYYSARWGREEKAGTTLVNHPARQPPLDNQPPSLPPSSRAANYPVCSVLPTDGRPMRKRDYGRWTCISFRLSFSRFLLSPLLFSSPRASFCLLFSVLLFFLSSLYILFRNFLQERSRISI